MLIEKQNNNKKGLFMKKATFNLSQFTKTAFYEGGKGLISQQTRAMMNCRKAKQDKKKTAQEAWDECLKEYNDSKKNDWAMKYAGSK